MSKKELKKNKKHHERLVQAKEKADGTKEYYITKSPQKTIFGKVIIITLCALLALGSVVALIFVLAQL